jgi:hypothetical protein
LGPNSGLLEVVKNSISIDGLKKALFENFKEITTLKQFF